MFLSEEKRVFYFCGSMVVFMYAVYGSLINESILEVNLRRLSLN